LLEADIRKHIRIENQLKLHIETVEDRVEELERDIAKLDNHLRNSELKDSQENSKHFENFQTEIKNL
jgi:hypothetical protein